MTFPQHQRALKFSLRWPLAGATILLTLAAVYAFWPLQSPPLKTTDAQAASPPAPGTSVLVPLNLAAFRAPLWVAPIPPPAPPPPPPPPPPLKLQLIAIARDQAGAVLSATLFDPDTGKLHTLVQGQAIGKRTLSRITPTAVDIRDDAGTRTLSLRVESSPGGAP